MPTGAHREMAIPRMFNCNTPFVVVTGESELSFPGNEDTGDEEEERDSLVQVIGPHLSRVMQRGTAKLAEAAREDNCVSIVAQAESEDIQEFSPSNTQSLYSRPQLVQKCRSLGQESVFVSDSEDVDGAPVPAHHHLHRKQRRKPRRRRSREDLGERPIIRGLWVQEIDWETPSSVDIIPPPPQFTDAVDQESRRGRSEEASWSEDEEDEEEDSSSSSNDRGDSDCSLDSVHTHQSRSDSSGEDSPHRLAAPRSTFDLMHVSGFDPSCQDDWLACVRGSPGDTLRSVIGCGEASEACEAVFDELRGKVTQISKVLVSAGLRGSFRQILNGWTTSSPANEGLIFHHLQPSSCGYREGEHYGVLHHIQNGSYGDVFCIRDQSTGFKCAAKKVPVSRFSSEEVSTWSALTSPRVVELFGAVREGPNVVLFMDLKPGCLGQLLKEAGCLQEDLALHYLHQTLGALEHLHRRKVLHLDVKADNVLLSADCRDTFLCDFGLAETLDDGDRGGDTFRGVAFPGTETHMAPEVARGDRLNAKADVWSSCCMLLHMLNGCQPWIRYYSPPLCLQIVNEPPPLWEVPSNCNNFTARVFRAGLQKEPERRASARELRRKTTKALRAVGGLSFWSIKTACETLRRVQTQNQDAPSSLSPVAPNQASPPASAPAMYWVSPWRMTAVDEDSDQDQDRDPEPEDPPAGSDAEPKSLRDDYATEDWQSGTDSEVDIYMGEEEWLKAEREYEGDWEEEGEEEEAQEVQQEEEEEEEEEWDPPESTEYLRALRGLFPLLQKGHLTKENSSGSEEELEYLRDGVAGGTRIGTPSPEPRDDPPSCFSCSDTSQIDASDADSDRSSDDLSSGVFSSCNSQTDVRLEWTASSNQPSSHCFEGVDVWIENVQGECLRIRERRRVKVGHVAIGISDQISGKAFTLETLDRKTVFFDQEIKDSGLWLRCVPAPDRCQRWRWRVRDGKLELRE